jgi:hypothetical protein
MRAIVSDAIQERQLPASTEVSAFLDTIIEALLVRLLIRHKQIDEEFVISVFDQSNLSLISAYPQRQLRTRKPPSDKVFLR